MDDTVAVGRVGVVCVLLTVGWLLVGGVLALFGTIPALWVGYGGAVGFTAGTLAVATGSPPDDTTTEAALGAGGALAGVAWLLVGAAAYVLVGALLPAVVGVVLVACGVLVFARYDSDEPAVDGWERDRFER
jgi:hypothetical protein